jgi:hypothetical protein
MGAQRVEDFSNATLPRMNDMIGAAIRKAIEVNMGKLICVVAVSVLLAALPVNAAKKKVPAAPLPAAISSAKKIFLSNGGGSNLAYDAFYAKMKEWGRYDVVGSPDDADLIVELAYRVESGGTRVWSTTNTYDNSTRVHSAQIVAPNSCLPFMTPRQRTHCGLRRIIADWRGWKRTGKRKRLFRQNVWWMT